MRIRPAIFADRPAIAAIHIESWRDAYRGLLPDAYLDGPAIADLSAKWARAELRAEDLHLIAEVERRPTGFVAAHSGGAGGVLIDNLHTRPALRGRGVGARLMRAAAEALLARGVRSAHLWVFADNAGAIRFYERLGARRAGRETKEFFGQPAPSVRMVWDDLSVIPARVGACDAPRP